MQTRSIVTISFLSLQNLLSFVCCVSTIVVRLNFCVSTLLIEEIKNESIIISPLNKNLQRLLIVLLTKHIIILLIYAK